MKPELHAGSVANRSGDRRIISASLTGKNCPCFRRIHGEHRPFPIHAANSERSIGSRRVPANSRPIPALFWCFPRNSPAFPPNSQRIPPLCSAFPRNPSPFPRRAVFSPEIPGCSPAIPAVSPGLPPVPANSQAAFHQDVMFANSASCRNAGGSPAWRAVWNLRAGRPRPFRSS